MLDVIEQSMIDLKHTLGFKAHQRHEGTETYRKEREVKQLFKNDEDLTTSLRKPIPSKVLKLAAQSNERNLWERPYMTSEYRVFYFFWLTIAHLCDMIYTIYSLILHEG